MPILHQKVSGKADGSDPTLIQPSDWTAMHSNLLIGPAADVTIPAGVCEMAVDSFEVQLGYKLEVGTGSIFMVA